MRKRQEVPPRPKYRLSRKNQLQMLENQPLAYGGELLKSRKGREHGRPLDTKSSMHLVLRSSQARGPWSFKRPKNERRVSTVVYKFAKKYGVRIYSVANVGNHLHMQIKLSNRYTYAPFIRAVTSAIAMAVTGRSRWSQGEERNLSRSQNHRRLKFWDYRPYTRIVRGLRAVLTLQDYIQVNKWEGEGLGRDQSRMIVKAVEGTKRLGAEMAKGKSAFGFSTA